MSRPRRVRVRGPLASYAVAFEESLAGQGYRSASDHLYVMAQLSRWLGSEKLSAADLSASGVEEFVRWRTASGYVSGVSSTRLSRLIDFLVGIGAARPLEPAVVGSPVESLIERYSFYLVQERGFQATASGSMSRWPGCSCRGCQLTVTSTWRR